MGHPRNNLCFFNVFKALINISDCGTISSKQPLFLGRNVTLSFTSAEGVQCKDVNWSKDIAGDWTQLNNPNKYIQTDYIDSHLLVIVNTTTHDMNTKYVVKCCGEKFSSIFQLNLTGLF